MRSIRAFVAAYEERSFTLAAARIGATQSGISQHVRNLEDRYDVVLFHREKGRVLPTAVAETFYTQCLKVLRETDAAFMRLKHFGKGLCGDTRIGLMPTLNAGALAPTLLDFREQHRNARVHIVEAYSAALIQSVIDGELDAAIVPAMPDRPGLRVTAFCTTMESMVARRGTFDQPDPVSLRDIGPLKLILPEIANVRAVGIRTFLNTQNVDFAEVIEINSMMATLDLIARSDWCAILPALMMATHAYGDAFDVRPIDPAYPLQLVKVQQAQRELPPVAAAFCDALAQSCMELTDNPSA